MFYLFWNFHSNVISLDMHESYSPCLNRLRKVTLGGKIKNISPCTFRSVTGNTVMRCHAQPVDRSIALHAVSLNRLASSIREHHLLLSINPCWSPPWRLALMMGKRTILFVLEDIYGAEMETDKHEWVHIITGNRPCPLEAPSQNSQKYFQATKLRTQQNLNKKSPNDLKIKTLLLKISTKCLHTSGYFDGSQLSRIWESKTLTYTEFLHPVQRTQPVIRD